MIEAAVNQIVALRDKNSIGVYTVEKVVLEEVAYLIDVHATPAEPKYYLYSPVRLLERVPQFVGDEVWMETSLLIGDEVRERSTDYSGGLRSLDDEDRKAIRNQCYRLLGGNGVKVVEDVKAKVRDLIQRAEDRLVA